MTFILERTSVWHLTFQTSFEDVTAGCSKWILKDKKCISLCAITQIRCKVGHAIDTQACVVSKRSAVSVVAKSLVQCSPGPLCWHLVVAIFITAVLNRNISCGFKWMFSPDCVDWGKQYKRQSILSHCWWVFLKWVEPLGKPHWLGYGHHWVGVGRSAVFQVNDFWWLLEGNQVRRKNYWILNKQSGC